MMAMRVLMAVVLGVAASGCSLLEELGFGRHGAPPSTAVGSADDEYLDWARDEARVVVVRKSCRTLDVYRHGHRIASYPAVFGLGGPAPKMYEGDTKTPTGLYMVIGKRPHPKWRHFMLLDYPNTHDWERYAMAVDRGEIPMRGGAPAGIGGAIGIHGTDKPRFNARGIDWTWGCVSLANDDIERLNAQVSQGTLVLIQD